MLERRRSMIDAAVAEVDHAPARAREREAGGESQVLIEKVAASRSGCRLMVDVDDLRVFAWRYRRVSILEDLHEGRGAGVGYLVSVGA